MLSIPIFHWCQWYSKVIQFLQPSSPWQNANSISDTTYSKELTPERSLMLTQRASNWLVHLQMFILAVSITTWWSPFAGNSSGNQISQLIIQGTSDTKLARFRIKPQSWWSFLKVIRNVHSSHTTYCSKFVSKARPFPEKMALVQKSLTKRTPRENAKTKIIWWLFKINNGGGDFLSSEKYLYS